MQSIALTGLLKIELPGADVLLCDGGFVDWAGDTYRARDPLFGTIASLDAFAEGVGDFVPALDVEFYPPDDAPIGDLSKPGYQQSRARFWVAQYDAQTGQVIGTPHLKFDGQIDQTSLRLGTGERTLAVTVVSTAEILFEGNTANGFNSAFHKANNPGELGHDNGTGLNVPVAWGVEAPRGGGVGGGAGGGRVRGPGRGGRIQEY